MPRYLAASGGAVESEDQSWVRVIRLFIVPPPARFFPISGTFPFGLFLFSVTVKGNFPCNALQGGVAVSLILAEPLGAIGQFVGALGARVGK